MIDKKNLDDTIRECVFNALDKFAQNYVNVSIGSQEQRQTDRTVYEFISSVEHYGIKLLTCVKFYETMKEHYKDKKRE